MAWNQSNRWGWGQQTAGSKRWNETCVLVAKTYETDEEGVPQPTDARTEVFCSPKVIGASTWSSMYEIGVSADAQVYVRTCDYDGQANVFYRDGWYSVENIQEKGDFTCLTMRHQKSDTDDDPDYGKETQEGGEGDGD